MSKNDTHPSVKKEVQKSWNRFLNNSYTNNDLLRIMESLKHDSNSQEFYEMSEQEWELSLTVQQLETETQREEYRQQAAGLLANYERNRQSQRVRSPQGLTQKRKYFRVTSYVAILLCLVAIPAIYYYLKPDSLSTIAIQYIEATTGRGEMKTITLPDSSSVTLNANTTIKYPAVFAKEERLIELQGEASFDVAQNPVQPFVVKTTNTTVKVQGTIFDVKAYQEDQFLMVTVVSGKVLVTLPDGQALLEKNQQLKFDKVTGNIEKQSVDAVKYLLWADGKLYFYRTPVREVVNMLNRHYPLLNLELAKGDYPNIITGEHDNKSSEAILTSIIYSTGIKCRKEKNKIILY